ncbi:MAG: OmpA family protein, partial [Bacteroidota bacterium]
ADSYLYCGDLHAAAIWYHSALQDAPDRYSLHKKYCQTLWLYGKTKLALAQLDAIEAGFGKRPETDHLRQKIEAALDKVGLPNQYYVARVLEMSSNADELPSYFRKGEIFFHTVASRRKLRNNHKIRNSRKAYSTMAAQHFGPGYNEKIRVVHRKVTAEIEALGMMVDNRRNEVMYSRKVVKKMKLKGGQGSSERFRLFQKWYKPGGREVELPLELRSGIDNDIHPALHPNGQLLVFASDRSGSQGRYDLFYALRQGDGWSKPIPFPVWVNSPGDEFFPSFNAAGTLYFTSDGLAGLGGYDLYSTTYEDGIWLPAANLGSAINTAFDEMAMCWAPDHGSARRNEGYFASNRFANGVHGTDLFFFRRNTAVRLAVEDSLSGLSPAGLRVSLIDERDNRIPCERDPQGNVVALLPNPGASYRLSFAADGYHAKDMVFFPKRELAQGEDFTRNVKLESVDHYEVNLSVMDSLSGAGLASGAVVALDFETMAKVEAATIQNGKARFNLRSGRDYVFVVESPGYAARNQHCWLKDAPRRGVLDREVRLIQGEGLLVEGKVAVEGEAPLNRARLFMVDRSTQKIVVAEPLNAQGDIQARLAKAQATSYDIYVAAENFLTAVRPNMNLDSLSDALKMPLQNLPYSDETPALTLYYPTGASELPAFTNQQLDAIYFFLTQNESAIAEIRAHTDHIGDAANNMKLSYQRGLLVVEYICNKRDIPRTRVMLKPYGESRPHHKYDDPEHCTTADLKADRRVEIFLLEPLF